MKSPFLRTLPRILLTGALYGLAVQLGSSPADAATAGGTVINNTATASYSDGTTTYNTNSNQVTTTVQNVPSFTDTPGSAQTVAPGQTVTDTFTLTNTGNGPATFTIGSATATASAGTSPTVASYTLTVGASTTPYASLAALQTALNATPVASGSSVVVGVVYSNPTTATAPATITTALNNVTATQAAVGGAASVTSAPTSASVADLDKTDARLDVQIAQSQNGTTGAITYTVTANNGGNFSAKDLTSVKTLLGSTNAGDFVVAKIPSYGGVLASATPTGTNYLSNVTVTANTANGIAASAAETVYTTTDPTGKTGWAALAAGATIPANTTFVGVLVSGATGGNEFAADPTGSTGSGAVTAPALTFSYTVNQPTGPGSADTTPSYAYNVVANSAVGNNAATEAIVAPTVTTTTADGAGTAAVNAVVAAIVNTTPAAAPSGASNQVSISALATTAVLNGPFGAPAAIGSYDGVSAVNNSDDFYALSFSPSGFVSVNSSTTVGSPTGNVTAAAVPNINAHDSVQNGSNSAQTIALSASSPGAGWSYQFFTDTGSAVGTALAPANTAASVLVASGATYNYYVVYTAPSGVQALARYDSVVTATIGGTTSNTVHNELYSGFVALTKSVAVTTSNCPANGVNTSGGTAFNYPVAGVCPGGTLQYTVAYNNIVPNPGTGNTEPASALAGVTTTAGSLAITEDGTGISGTGNANANNWALYTNGLVGAPAATLNGATDAAITYVYSPTAGTAAGSTKFVATPGGASAKIAPASSGTVVFSVVVK